MALHAGIDAYLKRAIGSSNYSVSGSQANLSASISLDHHTLDELLSVAWNTHHDVKVVSGTVSVIPRS